MYVWCWLSRQPKNTQFQHASAMRPRPDTDSTDQLVLASKHYHLHSHTKAPAFAWHNCCSLQLLDSAVKKSKFPSNPTLSTCSHKNHPPSTPKQHVLHCCTPPQQWQSTCDLLQNPQRLHNQMYTLSTRTVTQTWHTLCCCAAQRPVRTCHGWTSSRPVTPLMSSKLTANSQCTSNPP